MNEVYYLFLNKVILGRLLFIPFLCAFSILDFKRHGGKGGRSQDAAKRGVVTFRKNEH